VIAQERIHAQPIYSLYHLFFNCVSLLVIFILIHKNLCIDSKKKKRSNCWLVLLLLVLLQTKISFSVQSFNDFAMNWRSIGDLLAIAFYDAERRFSLVGASLVGSPFKPSADHFLHQNFKRISSKQGLSS
jgi:hypothetical protein